MSLSIPAMRCIFLLGALFHPVALAAASCYWPNGDQALGYTPCFTDNGASHCCVDGEVCMSNGFCQDPDLGENTWYFREACTDQTWDSPACPKHCISDNSDYEGMVLQCDATSYCCYGGSVSSLSYTDGSCCNDKKMVFEAEEALPMITARDGISPFSSLLGSIETALSILNGASTADSSSNENSPKATGASQTANSHKSTGTPKTVEPSVTASASQPVGASSSAGSIPASPTPNSPDSQGSLPGHIQPTVAPGNSPGQGGQAGSSSSNSPDNSDSSDADAAAHQRKVRKAVIIAITIFLGSVFLLSCLLWFLRRKRRIAHTPVVEMTFNPATSRMVPKHQLADTQPFASPSPPVPPAILNPHWESGEISETRARAVPRRGTPLDPSMPTPLRIFNPLAASDPMAFSSPSSPVSILPASRASRARFSLADYPITEYVSHDEESGPSTSRAPFSASDFPRHSSLPPLTIPSPPPTLPPIPQMPLTSPLDQLSLSTYSTLPEAVPRVDQLSDPIPVETEEYFMAPETLILPGGFASQSPYQTHENPFRDPSSPFPEPVKPSWPLPSDQMVSAENAISHQTSNNSTAPTVPPSPIISPTATNSAIPRRSSTLLNRLRNTVHTVQTRRLSILSLNSNHNQSSPTTPTPTTAGTIPQIMTARAVPIPRLPTIVTRSPQVPQIPVLSPMSPISPVDERRQSIALNMNEYEVAELAVRTTPTELREPPRPTEWAPRFA